MRSFFCLVLLEGCRDDEEKESFEVKNLEALCVHNAISWEKSHVINIFLCNILQNQTLKLRILSGR